MMVVRLTRKLAEEIDGIDLRSRHVGDVLYLDGVQARLLIAEGWAVPYLRARRPAMPRAEAADAERIRTSARRPVK